MKIWDWIKMILGIGIGGSMSTVSVVLTNDSSPGADGMQLDASSSASESLGEIPGLADSSGGITVAGASVGVAGLTSSAGPALTTEDSSPGIDLPGGGRIWEDSSGDLHVDWNTVPYSYVEKRAQQAYDVLHGKLLKQYKFPAVVVESKEALERFEDVFGKNPSPAKLTETLKVLERALEEKRTDETNS